MPIVSAIVASLSIFLILATVASLIKLTHWWVRIFDFPKLQISVAIAIVILADLVVLDFGVWWHYGLTGLLFISLIYQAWWIYPYTLFAKKQVMRFPGDDPTNSISLLVCNVLMTNKNTDYLIKMVQNLQPQVFLTLETDEWWEEQLRTIEASYPYTVKVPLDNLYGMHLYSQLPLEEARVNYRVKPGIPSIEAYLKLPDGQRIKTYCLHPMPPSPTESETSTSRDAELLLVAKALNTDKEPVLVFGDLNDVAWSPSTRLFQKISGLLDPRIGRGFFNTFHAKYPMFRWPLDHIFHSNDFTLKSIKRLPYMGSDHFPMYVELHHEPQAKRHQEEPDATHEDQKEANEKIALALM